MNSFRYRVSLMRPSAALRSTSSFLPHTLLNLHSYYSRQSGYKLYLFQIHVHSLTGQGEGGRESGSEDDRESNNATFVNTLRHTGTFKLPHAALKITLQGLFSRAIFCSPSMTAASIEVTYS